MLTPVLVVEELIITTVAYKCFAADHSVLMTSSFITALAGTVVLRLLQWHEQSFVDCYGSWSSIYLHPIILLQFISIISPRPSEPTHSALVTLRIPLY